VLYSKRHTELSSGKTGAGRGGFPTGSFGAGVVKEAATAIFKIAGSEAHVGSSPTTRTINLANTFENATY